MSQFDRFAAINKVCPRAEFVPVANPQTLAEIKCGVFFVMAFWSGPARKAFAALTRVLDRLDPDGRLRLVVGDTDEMQELHDRPPFIDILSGSGETLWIANGQIVADSGHGLNVECFEPNTRELLAKCRGQ